MLEYFVEISTLFCRIDVWVRSDGNDKQTGLYSGYIYQRALNVHGHINILFYFERQA